MRPLSAFNASASVLGKVQANWTVRSIGPGSFQGELLLGAGKSGNRAPSPERETRLTIAIQMAWLVTGSFCQYLQSTRPRSILHFLLKTRSACLRTCVLKASLENYDAASLAQNCNPG